MNISLHDFQAQERIERAKDLLRAKPPLTLGEIARRCGFTSATRLNLVFRRNVGVSPVGWRSQ
jgi:AraC family transcriptional regulator